MARHYTTREFFRQMPNALLARYFWDRGLFAELDFAAMKETKPDPLFNAWLALDDGERNQMDAEFREITSLSCEGGFCAIRDEAAWKLRENPAALSAFVEKLASLEGHPERAMVTFLEHQEFWKGSTLFYHADSLSYWREAEGITPCRCVCSRGWTQGAGEPHTGILSSSGGSREQLCRGDLSPW